MPKKCICGSEKSIDSTLKLSHPEGGEGIGEESGISKKIEEMFINSAKREFQRLQNIKYDDSIF